MSILDYTAAIKIAFDKPIVTDPAIILGTEYYEMFVPEESAHTFFSSGVFSGQPTSYAFDNNTSTYWRNNVNSVPQWIGKDFGREVPLTKVSVYLNGAKPGTYKLQASHDNTNWDDVTTGTFTSTTGWQDVIFTQTTYRYWRLYITSIPSGFAYIYEIKFYNTRNKYDVAAYTVTSQQYDRAPEGVLITKNYTIRKVTKSEDGLSITIWLDLTDRMKAPIGDVTVTYVKTLGNLAGRSGSVVEDFSVNLTPTGLTSQYIPNAPEHLSAQAKITVSSFDVIYKYGYSAEEHLSATPNITITVTNVGGLPL